MDIKIPEVALILIIGIEECGLEFFLKKHFNDDEIIHLESNGAEELTENEKVFIDLKQTVTSRLEVGKLTVVDARLLVSEQRRELVKLAKEFYCPTFAIILLFPEKKCIQWHSSDINKSLDLQNNIKDQYSTVKKSLKKIKREGIKTKFYFSSISEMENLNEIIRVPLQCNMKEETGPFDIIGDIHGCYDELEMLLEKLAYRVCKVEENFENFGIEVTHPEKRKIVFLGDLVDRGPKSPQVLKLVMSMVNAGNALCILGNHDEKFLRKLKGRNVKVQFGLEQTMKQMEKVDRAFSNRVAAFLQGLQSHLVLDKGNLVVAHAGIKERMQGRISNEVEEFCLYGETTNKRDEYGLPVRYNWAKDYRGKAIVAYGHTPVDEPVWVNKTIDIDTGGVFGGTLTALRYPEIELISVPALKEYYPLGRPFFSMKIS